MRTPHMIARRQRRSDDEIALGGVPAGQVDHPLRHLQEFRQSRRSGAWRPRGIDQPQHQRRVADRLEQAYQFEANCDASSNREWTISVGEPPAHAHRQRHLVPGGVGKFTQLVEPGVGHGAPRSQALAHSSVRGAIRIAARSGRPVGQSVGDLSRRCQLVRAAVMSRWVSHVAGAHVPANARADRPPTPDVRRSARHSPRPNRGHAAWIAAASRRCSSARSAFSWDS